MGCPRSGTTLLQSRLLKVEGTYSLPETHFFENLQRNHFVNRRSLPPLEAPEYPEALDRTTAHRILAANMKKELMDDRIQHYLQDLDRRLDSHPPSIADYFDEVVRLCSPRIDRYPVEKTPGHVFHIDYIRRLFPEAIIFGIVRDPRDVYLSFTGMLARQHKAARSVSELCFLWNAAVDAMLDSGIRYLRYEDFIGKPDQALTELLEDVDVQLGEDKPAYDEIIRSNEVWKNKVAGRVLEDNKGRYLEELDPRASAEIAHQCEANMTGLGYDTQVLRRRSVWWSLRDRTRWSAVRVRIHRDLQRYRRRCANEHGDDQYQ